MILEAASLPQVGNVNRKLTAGLPRALQERAAQGDFILSLDSDCEEDFYQDGTCNMRDITPTELLPRLALMP